MKNIWHSSLNFVKKRKILSSIIALIILVIGGYVAFGGEKGPEYNTAIAKRGDITQEVSATGRVKAAKSVDLAFEKTGKVSYVYVNVRDKVATGQQLVALTNDDIYAQLLQAQAGVANAQATLDELKKGSRLEDIAISKSALQKAQQDLDNYYSNTLDVLNDSYAKADDAARKQTDLLFSNDETDNPQMTFTSSDSQAQIDAQWQRAVAKDTLNKWKVELDNLKINRSNSLIDQSLSNSKQRLESIRAFLDRLTVALQNAIGISSATTDTYNANLNTARTSVNTAASNIGNQEQSIASQKITVQKSQDELNLKLAGSTPEKIAAQEAAVTQAKANVKNYEAQLEKTIIRSPFNGIVTKQNAKVGEIANLNTSVVSVISAAKFEIEAFIPEVDIAKIKIKDVSAVTLDAYGDDKIFEAKVVAIDPAETIIEGVATYKTTLQFNEETELIKPGMTANLDILTNVQKNVIYVPQRAVKGNGQKTVIILNSDGSTKEVPVETGLRGSSGNIEILLGINEGETVVVSEKQ